MSVGTVLASLLSIVLAIALVAGLAFGFVYLLRMWQDRSMAMAEGRGAGRGMRFLRTLPLGQTERIVMVEVGEEVLLLGVASQSVTLLKSWPAADAPISLDRGDAGPFLPAQLAQRWSAVPRFRGRRSPEAEG